VQAEVADLKAQLAAEQRRAQEARARAAAELLAVRQELLVRPAFGSATIARLFDRG
jgi:hypothetical protein